MTSVIDHLFVDGTIIHVGISRMTKKKPGAEFELAVARIQQKLDPNSKVTHNERLVDRIGIKRQCDVVIRGQFGGRPVFGVIECKDHKRKKGVAEIEAFAKKTENLGANLRMMFSKCGFTKSALELAAHEHIECFSTLNDDPRGLAPKFGSWWYAYHHSFGALEVTFFFTEQKLSLPEFEVNNVMLHGQRVMAWFEHQLATEHANCPEPGVRITLEFDKPQMLEMMPGKLYEVSGISVYAPRVVRKLKKWITYTGDATYEWATKRLTLPANTPLIAWPLENGIEGWIDYDGDIELQMKNNRGEFLVCCFTMLQKQYDPHPDAIDLLKY